MTDDELTRRVIANLPRTWIIHDTETGRAWTWSAAQDTWVVGTVAPEPDMFLTDRWRQGRKVRRTIYAQRGDEPSDDDPLIGVMDTPALAFAVVYEHNKGLE
jgi:hypothetical protein